MKSSKSTLLAVPLLLLACESPTRREPTPGVPVRIAPLPPPPPAPQVMITGAPPTELGGGAVSPISEEQRTELLRAAGSPIRSYSPPPFSPPVETVYVDRSSYGASSGYGADYPPSYEPWWSIARMAAYTGMGAIIGHQFDDQGAGAAIGAGVALLTSPWGIGPYRY
jgi:hypothetical protein